MLVKVNCLAEHIYPAETKISSVHENLTSQKEYLIVKMQLRDHVLRFTTKYMVICGTLEERKNNCEWVWELQESC